MTWTGCANQISWTGLHCSSADKCKHQQSNQFSDEESIFLYALQSPLLLCSPMCVFAMDVCLLMYKYS